MDDVFARIGLALERLLHQSTVHGPEKEEVARLAAELQRFEGSINTVINERILAATGASEGRVYAHIDQNFAQLATVLEAAELQFEPSPAPVPLPEPSPPDPVLEPQADPAPITGNIPHVPEEPAPEPVPPAGNDTVAPPEGPAPAPEPLPPVVEPDPGPETISAPGPVDSLPGGAGNDTISGPDTVSGVADDSPNTPTNDVLQPPPADPDNMTVAEALDWLDQHNVDHAGITLRDDLRGLVKLAMEDEAEKAIAAGEVSAVVQPE